MPHPPSAFTPLGIPRPEAPTTPENPMALWATETQPNHLRLGFEVTETLFHGQSDFQTVDVVDTKAYGRLLLLDGLVMTTEADEFVYHEHIAHIPMLSHPNPKSVLVIGGGDGGTVREVLKHPSVERVVLCEIDKLVVDASREWLPTIAGALDDPRVECVYADGVAYVANAEPGSFDVILVDSTDPLGPGVGLFTEAFYQSVSRALSANGVMAAQTESPIATPREMQLIYGHLAKVFTHVAPYVATIPTYPGALWSWGYCAKTLQPLASATPERVAAITQTTQWLTAQNLSACLAVPRFVQTLLAPVLLQVLPPAKVAAGVA